MLPDLSLCCCRNNWRPHALRHLIKKKKTTKLETHNVYAEDLEQTRAGAVHPALVSVSSHDFEHVVLDLFSGSSPSPLTLTLLQLHLPQGFL